MNRKTIWPKAVMAVILVAAISVIMNFGNAAGDIQDTKSDSDILDRPINTLRDFNKAFIDISAKVKPTVVTVSTERILRQRFMNPFGFPFANDPFIERFFGRRPQQNQPEEREFRQQGLGSGVIVSSDGLIITNNHVIAEADSIYVQTHDGDRFSAEVVGTDQQTDIAVLRIDADGLDYLNFGNSDDLQVGEMVIAIGSPMSQNLAYSVTQGIVSAKGRSNVGLAEYEDFIQTDAAINPGNSGGPLVNLDGELVGINTAIVTRSGGYQGIGFAVPSLMAESIMRSLVDEGRVIRGWLGVYIQDVSEEIAQAFDLEDNKGALVSEVVPDSPAEDAGLQTGDVIVEVEGREIETATELRSTIASAGPDSKVKMKVLRDGRTEYKNLRLGELPEEDIRIETETDLEELLGFAVGDLNRQLAERYSLDRWTDGIVVTEIDPYSKAGRAGLREGDQITGVNRSRVANKDEFESRLSGVEQGDNVLLNVVRGGRNLFVAFTV
ncbi:MAG: DegQ family serine endoprotease [Candidatus Zixiibacteriota bacterium]|nr:MAG: DegQ family serine endoprotease [candidate division Zixibacteria bacterium]